MDCDDWKRVVANAVLQRSHSYTLLAFAFWIAVTFAYIGWTGGRLLARCIGGMDYPDGFISCIFNDIYVEVSQCPLPPYRM